LFKTAVADLARPIEEHRPCQRVARLALVQAGVHPSMQFHTLQPVQDCVFQPIVDAVSAGSWTMGVAHIKYREFAQHQQRSMRQVHVAGKK